MATDLFENTPQASSSWRRHRPAWIAVAVAAAVVAGGIWSRHSQAQQLQADVERQSLPVVKLAALQPMSAGTVELPARLEAWATAPIHARVSGYLKRWTTDIGTPVKAGQLLAEIETPELDEQLAQARAELATARSHATLAASTAQRWRLLLASDSVSRQEADEKAADLAARESIVNALQANADRVAALKQYARLVAPFDGVVTARNTDTGALISAGGGSDAALFVVSDTHQLRVYVDVPQRQLAAVGVGQSAVLSVPERPGQSFTATVQSVARAIQADSGAMRVQLLVDNRSGDLLPGAFATVRFDAAAKAPTDHGGAVGLPPSALIFGKDGARVAIVGAGEQVQIKPVTIARDLGSLVEIASGLQPGDRVIDSPPDGLASGERVRLAAPTAQVAS